MNSIPVLVAKELFQAMLMVLLCVIISMMREPAFPRAWSVDIHVPLMPLPGDSQ